jgi:hypothetical protein
MSHDTTLPAHVRQGLPNPAGESLDAGPHTGRLIVDVDDPRFRVRTPGYPRSGSRIRPAIAR